MHQKYPTVFFSLIELFFTPALFQAPILTGTYCNRMEKDFHKKVEPDFRAQLVDKFKAISLWRIFWMSIAGSEFLTLITVFVIGIIYRHEIPYDYLVVGAITAFFVASIITPIVVYLAGQLHKIEGVLWETEQKSRVILESIQDGYYEVDIYGKITFLNDSLCKILGYPRDKLLGASFHQATDQESAKIIDKSLNQVIETGEPAEGFDLKIIRENGTKRHINASAALIKDAESRRIGVRGIVRDITEQKRSEEALEEAKEYIENIINSMADSLIVIKPDLIISLVNRTTCDLLGYNESELIGAPIDKILYDGISFAETLFRQFKEKGFVKDYEMLYRMKSGEKIPVSFVGSVMYSNGDNAENIIGLICVAHDLRAIKGLQEQVLQSEKMASIGVLAAGVAHEIKNPLAIILGGIEFIKFSLSSNPDNNFLQDSIERIKKATLRTDKIVTDLMDFSRQTPATFEEIEIIPVIEDTISLVERRLNIKNIKVIRQFPSDLPKIEADSNQLKQVLINILVNSVESMPDGGTITIIPRACEHTPEERYLQITFTDTGQGIPEDNIQKVSEPFFSTKTDAGNTGLGLSVTRGIIEKHHGDLTIESEMGKGTKVIIRFPYKS